MYRLSVSDLSKRFGPRKVVSNINFELTAGDSLAVTGPNGAGKSTLLMCLLGQHRPTKGKVVFFDDDRPMTESEIQFSSALVAPYLQLYGELTGEENIKFFAAMRGLSPTGKQINAILDRMGLAGRGHDLLAEYSSGMAQRLKYAAAFLGEPTFLFLDEPTANLDEDGKKIILSFIEEIKARCALVVATNEREEYALGQSECRLGG
ncbi:MAG: ABC transporter ATP-binding protein [candidate division Zixibacteria bacterium]|nr:ABC transporter ATP-binding protein [candidate division Zixibacteria bacterium]